MTKEQLLDKASNMWEQGVEMSNQLNYELKHTHWDLKSISN